MATDDDRAEFRRQIDDLAALKDATRRRHSLAHGSAEWVAALADEKRLIDRIRAWPRRTRDEP